MSSMMAQRVATNNLAHSYMAFNTNYHDTGLFGVYAVSDPKSQPVDDLVRYCNLLSFTSCTERGDASEKTWSFVL
jgi:hypothetical protein